MEKNKSLQILLVDDKIAITNIMKRSFKRKGLHVKCASNGEEALDIFTKNKFDILITDIYMPKMNGIELVKRVREKNKNIPIIVMSSYSTDATLDILKKEYHCSFIEKPMKFKDLYNLTLKRLKMESEIEEVIISPKKNIYKPITIMDISFTKDDDIIIVADDNPHIRTEVIKALQRKNIIALPAANGEEVLELLSKYQNIKLVLLDINMAPLNGIDTLKEIEKHKFDVFKILMSGEAVDEQVHDGLNAGGYTIIRKPFKMDDFLNTIEWLKYVDDKKRKQQKAKEVYENMTYFEKMVKHVKYKIKMVLVFLKKNFVIIMLTIMIVIIISFSFLFFITTGTETIFEKIDKAESYFDRLEGYLIRDEQRELKK